MNVKVSIMLKRTQGHTGLWLNPCTHIQKCQQARVLQVLPQQCLESHQSYDSLAQELKSPLAPDGSKQGEFPEAK